MRSFLLVPFLVVALVSPALAQSPTEQVFDRLNEVRAANGLPALLHDERLDRAAAAHTAEMATLSSLFHVSETSGSPLDRAHGVGIESDDIAENVSMHDSALDAQASLEASPSHFANMVGPRFTHVGIGVVATSDGVYVTELFAHLEGATPPAVADAAPTTPDPAPTTPTVAPPISSPGAGGAVASAEVPVAPTTPAATAPTTTSTGAIVVPPSPTGTVTVPSPAPGVTGYWICANQRWYYYPVPAGAGGGTRLTADTTVAGPPPGHTSEECMMAAPGGPSGYAPPPTATPSAPPPPPPSGRGGSVIRVEPGRIITPWGTIRTR